MDGSGDGEAAVLPGEASILGERRPRAERRERRLGDRDGLLVSLAVGGAVERLREAVQQRQEDEGGNRDSHEDLDEGEAALAR